MCELAEIDRIIQNTLDIHIAPQVRSVIGIRLAKTLILIIRRCRDIFRIEYVSYAGADTLTRKMCLDLLEYVSKDAHRKIHIYYKLIDKPLKDKNNALA